MLKISDIILNDGIILNVQNSEKIGVIRELAQKLIEQNLITNTDEFFSAILRRENLESTGIGQGVAIPHARTSAVKNIAIVFGRSLGGVDFSSLDGQPSHLIFLIAAPDHMKTEYIMTLARLSRLLRRSEVRSALMAAQTSQDVIEIIKQYE
ncbi:MAG: fructose PTS transporter subunit IIA [candidate division WOR-3 bacterium]|nr:fructose PTS transporter subunit IIA [candidate division WOR-3 bacterium]